MNGYILLWIVLVLCINFEEMKVSKFFFDWIYIVSFVLFFGLRGFVWTDWQHYYVNFNNIEPITELLEKNLFFSNIGYEFGYKIYMSTIKMLTDNYFIFIFISTLIDVYLLRKIFKYYSINLIFGFLIFIGFEGLVLQFDLLRNSKALLIFLYSLRYFDERKKNKYLCLNIIAITFHKSIFFNFFLTFFLKQKIKKYYLWILFIIFNLYRILNIKLLNIFILRILFIFPTSLVEKYYFYLNDNFYGKSKELSLFSFFEKGILFLSVILLYDKIIKENKKNIIILNSSIVYFFIYYILWEFKILEERFGVNYSFIYWLLLPIMLKGLSCKKRIIIKNIMGIYILLKLLKNIVLINNIGVQNMLKYENILFHHKTYETRINEYYEYQKFILK